MWDHHNAQTRKFYTSTAHLLRNAHLLRRVAQQRGLPARRRQDVNLLRYVFVHRELRRLVGRVAARTLQGDMGMGLFQK